MSDGSHTARKPWPWPVSTGYVVREGQEFGVWCLRGATNVLGAMPIPTYEGRRTYFFFADGELRPIPALVSLEGAQPAAAANTQLQNTTASPETALRRRYEG